MNNIHIGTSGWSYKHWRNLFYPPDVKPANWFHYYADRFNTVELNSSFYRLPTVKTVEGWAQKAPEGFLFCPKMNRLLTQYKKLREPEEPLERFFEVFAPLQGKMGPVLVQLPPSGSFNYDVAEHFFQLLQTSYGANTFVLEIRHLSWLHTDALTLMAQYNIGLVISQSDGRFPYAEMPTATTIYVRFHGPEALYASNYSTEMLQAYADKFSRWRQEGHTIWAFFNNDIHGFATENARQLIELCGNGSVTG